MGVCRVVGLVPRGHMGAGVAHALIPTTAGSRVVSRSAASAVTGQRAAPKSARSLVVGSTLSRSGAARAGGGKVKVKNTATAAAADMGERKQRLACRGLAPSGTLRPCWL